MSKFKTFLGSELRRVFPRPMKDLDLGRYARTHLLPNTVSQSDEFVPETKVGEIGVDLCDSEQLKRLSAWGALDLHELWDEIRRDPRINLREDIEGSGKLVQNNYYPSPDPEIYAAMISELKPTMIVEVGAGFSTLVARRSIDYLGLDCELVVIDPEPRTDIAAAATKVIRNRIEDVDLSMLSRQEGLFFFVDSSHIARMRGDVNLIFCRVLGGLPPGTTIHVHDVYLPWDYPEVYDDWGWNEQYLLHCLLSGNSRYRVQFATHYMSRVHPSHMQSTLGNEVAKNGKFFGASFWFNVLDATSSSRE